jgi:hypothetical protein
MTPQKPQSSPKDFFLHLLATGTLFVSVVSFLVLLFQYIDVLFPDPLNFSLLGISETVRSSTSTLIVAFPVLLLVSWLIRKDIKKDAGKKDIRVRKWLISFTLFVAAITGIGDLVTIIYNYLGGELTTAFALQTISVLITAGIVFGYYITDLRDTKKKYFYSYSAYGSAALILVTIIAGFGVIGSPTTQRERRFDDQRNNDLQIIRSQINEYYNMTSKLPATLNEIPTKLFGYTIPQDPETKAEYEYHQKTADTFELCADFHTKSLELSESTPFKIYPGMEDWTHNAERTCFTRAIVKNPYPVPLVR